MRNTRGYAALFITVIIWGTTFVIIKVVLREIGPLQLAGLRLLLAFAVMAPLAARQGFKFNDVFQPKYVLFGLTGTTLYSALQNVGMTFTSVSSTVLILAIVPALTTLLAVIFLKERLTRSQIGGIILVTIGVVLVSMDSSASTESSNPTLGNLLIFASALTWAVYTIQGRRLAGNHSILVISTASTGAGLLMLLPLIGWEMATAGLPHLSLYGWLGMLYLGLAASALTTFLWNYALKSLPASTASAYINLIPVIGLASSYLLGEHAPLIQIAGGGLAILGVLLSSQNAPKSTD